MSQFDNNNNGVFKWFFFRTRTLVPYINSPHTRDLFETIDGTLVVRTPIGSNCTQSGRAEATSLVDDVGRRDRLKLANSRPMKSSVWRCTSMHRCLMTDMQPHCAHHPMEMAIVCAQSVSPHRVRRQYGVAFRTVPCTGTHISNSNYTPKRAQHNLFDSDDSFCVRCTGLFGTNIVTIIGFRYLHERKSLNIYTCTSDLRT